MIQGLFSPIIAAGLLAISSSEPRPIDSAKVRFHDGFPVTDPSQVIRPEELARGDLGVGYTVLEEDVLTPFSVEVLGILRDMLGPGRHVVLARLGGARIEFTGVVSGMSGSPVFIDGKLLGAVAYRFGAFSKEPIAGITPIGTMFETDRLTEPGGVASRLSPASASRTIGTKTSSDMQQIATPLSISGMDVDLVTKRLGQDWQVHAGGGPSPGRGRLSANQKSKSGELRAAALAPGSPISVMLMTGDITLSALGTVTFVHHDRLLAFGHPFMGTGQVSFPMSTAPVLNTLATPAGSYKQGRPALEVGRIEHDRLGAVAGRIGQAAELVPIRLFLEGLGTPRTVSVSAIQHPVWLPILTELAASGAATRRVDREDGGTFRIEATIVVGKYAVSFQDQFSGPAPFHGSEYAAELLHSMMRRVTKNQFEKPMVQSVEAKLSYSPEVHLASIESAVVVGDVLAAGETAEVIVELRRHQMPNRTLRIEIPVPTSVRGEVEIFVGDGDALAARESELLGPRTASDFESLLAQVAEHRPSNALYARMFVPSESARIGDDVFSFLPLSAQMTLPAPEVSKNVFKYSASEACVLKDVDVIRGGIRLSLFVKPKP
jgi:hypothetical protein